MVEYNVDDECAYVVIQRGGLIKQDNSTILLTFKQCIPFKIKVTQVTALQYYSCLTHLATLHCTISILIIKCCWYVLHITTAYSGVGCTNV